MSATGLNVFDRTLHTPNARLGEIADSPGPDRQVAWHAPGAVREALPENVRRLWSSDNAELKRHIGAAH